MDTYNSADTLDDETWDRVIAINLTAPVKLMRAVLPTMKQQTSGSVVNVASKAGTSGAAAGIAYTCSKHGLVRFFFPPSLPD
jgi:NAD(P)-dependent dehydrogenase (short-subunit alcohol dehydrogenase family)